MIAIVSTSYDETTLCIINVDTLNVSSSDLPFT